MLGLWTLFSCSPNFGSFTAVVGLPNIGNYRRLRTLVDKDGGGGAFQGL